MKALSILVAVGGLWPALAAAYAYTSQDSSGNVIKNQTVGIPVVWAENQPFFHPAFGGEFDAAVFSALDAWNAVGTRLQWRAGTGAADPCDHDDRINSGGWRGALCDNGDFGDVLAVTVRSSQTDAGGLFRHVDTDILVNQQPSWDIYDGALRPGTFDFRRVLLHELGHAAGLDHPDDAGQNKTAIMNSKTSDFFALQNDDRLGLIWIYAVNNDNTGGAAPDPLAPPPADGGGGAGGWLLLPLLWYRWARSHRRRAARGHRRAWRAGRPA